MEATLAAADHYRAELRRLSEGPGPAWLKSLRAAAFARFEALGYPTASQEEWRNTSPSSFAQSHPAARDGVALTRDDARAHAYGPMGGPELVFINGAYAPALSTLKDVPAGIRVQSLATALSKNPEELEHTLGQVAGFEGKPFTALNTALFRDGAYLRLARGVVLEPPIHFLFLGSAPTVPALHFPRVLVHAGSQAQARLVETYTGLRGSVHVTNAVTEIVLEDGAHLVRHKVQREPPTAHHLHAVEVEQARASVLFDHNIAFGGRVARTDIATRFQGEGADLTLNGLYVLRGDQHVDNHTSVDHLQPRCQSREFYKGVLDEQSRGVFYGKVFVRPGAQKTNASQTNKNLLLSEGALVDSTPALEIRADDVKCSHGSTIGQLDADSLFYLRTRGIDEPTARSLLTYGFARDILGQIQIPPLRSSLEDELLARLPNGRAIKEALYDAA